MTYTSPKAAIAALALVALSTLSLSVQAQKITALQVEPAKASVGQAIKATTAFEITNGAINCVVRLHWGDGQTQDFNVNQERDVPLVLEHSYAKAGTYRLMVEGKGGKKCLGKDQAASVDITPKVGVAAATAAVASAAASVCPTGWKLTKAGVSKKTGAFMCTAKAKTPIPEPKVVCPGELTYFENVKKGQLGCRV
ncbi:MAG TPA: hypothetical protein PKV17_12305 [Aquabacterium sp.]|nr:hypothetical protein [Aquabacterium sp.]